MCVCTGEISLGPVPLLTFLSCQSFLIGAFVLLEGMNIEACQHLIWIKAVLETKLERVVVFWNSQGLKGINVKHITQNLKHSVCACLVLALGNLTLVLVLRRVFEDKFNEMRGNTKYCTDVISNSGKSDAGRFFFLKDFSKHYSSKF